MSWTEYKAIQGKDAADLSAQLAPEAKEGWKPILISAVQGLIVVILEHVPGAGQHFQTK